MSALAGNIERFLAGAPHAVVGASRDRGKYGNKVLRAFLQRRRPVIPIHPYEETVEGVTAYARLAEVPQTVHGVCVITPPSVTEAIVEQAIEQGVRHIWLQPGAESPRAVRLAEAAGIPVIAGGPCILVALQYRESSTDEDGPA